MNPAYIGWISVMAAALVGAHQIIRIGNAAVNYLYQKKRTSEVNARFTRDVATNHLPHIYDALERIAGSNGIELKDRPPVLWEDLESRRNWK